MTERQATGSWFASAREVTTPGWVVLASSFLLGLGYLMAVPLLTSYVASNLGESVAVAGGIIAAMAITQRGVALFGGVLADALDRRNVFFIGVVLRALGFAIMASSSNLLLLVGGAMIGSVGGGLATPVLPSAIAIVADERTKTFLYSMRQSVANIAAALGPLIGSVLLLLGTTGAFWGAAAVHVIVLVFAIRYLPKLQGQASSRGPALRDLVVQPSRDRRLRALLVTLLFFWAIQTQLVVSFTTQAGRITDGGVDADARAVSWLYLVNGSLFVASQFLAFSAIKRLDPATLLGSGGGLMALGSVIAVSADSMPILIMGVVVFTVGEVLALPGVELMVSSIAPEQMLSSYFGLSSSVAGLGVAAGSSLGGLAMASGGYSPVLLLAGLGCGVVLGMVVLRRRIITADVRGCNAETV